MKIKGKEWKSLWFEEGLIKFIDQRKLPYSLEIFTAKNVNDCAFAIKEMVVRGAPAIGAAAVYGMVLGKENFEKTAETLRKTRPTAYDLFYAIDYMIDKIKNNEDSLNSANEYVEDIINRCKKIGENGEKIIKNNMKILTHCNAGALATVDYGTALAPFRIASRNKKNIPVSQAIPPRWNFQGMFPRVWRHYPRQHSCANARLHQHRPCRYIPSLQVSLRFPTELFH